MILKSISGDFVVEFSSTHAFLKVHRWEMFLCFERGGGAAGRKVIVSRT